MKSLQQISELGYYIQSIWQDGPDSWHVCFRSPYEWQLFKTQGKTLVAAATKAARLAIRRGDAYKASAAYRAREASRLAKYRERLKPCRVRYHL